MGDKMVLWIALISVCWTCCSQTWDEWLKDRASTNTPHAADRVVCMLAALEQGSHVVLQPGTTDFFYDGSDVSTEAGLTVFAQKVAKDIHLPHADISARFSKDCKSIRIDEDIHAKVLNITVGADCQDKPTVLKGLLCRRLAGMRINWDAVGSFVPESVRGKSKSWEWELKEINAARLGLGGVLLESAEVKSIIDGTTKQRTCTWHMNLKPADLAWAIAAAKLLRNQKLTLSCKSDLAKVSWIVGRSSVEANAERIRDQMKLFMASCGKGVPPSLPGTCCAWKNAVVNPSRFQGLTEKTDVARVEDSASLRSKGSSPSSQDRSEALPEYVQPTLSEIREWWGRKVVPLPQTPIPDMEKAQESKRKVKKLVARTLAENLGEDRRIEKLAQIAFGVNSSADRFFAFREAMSAAMNVKCWSLLQRLFSELVSKDGAEYALEVIRPVRMKLIGNRNATDLIKSIKATEKAIRFLTKNEATMSSVGADRPLLARVARSYLTLGSETNAWAAIACSDEKLDRLMRLTAGEQFRTHRRFWWEAPLPEFEVAEFWSCYAKDDPVLGPYCDEMGKVWYARALKGLPGIECKAVKPIRPAWMEIAQRRTNGYEGKDMVRDKWWTDYHIAWEGFKFPAAFGAYVSETVYEDGGRWGGKCAHRPSGYWLKQCEPQCWRKDHVRTLVVPVKSMPLLDSDFGETGGNFPSEENLDRAMAIAPKVTAKNLKTWVARYYNLPEAQVTLIDVPKKEIGHVYLYVSMVKFVQIGGRVVSVLIRVREEETALVHFIEVRSVDRRTGLENPVDEECFKRYIQAIR